MNLIREYIGTIAGAHVFAIAGMMIFLVVFILMIYHTCRLRKEDVKSYSRLPLDEDVDDQNENKNQ